LRNTAGAALKRRTFVGLLVAGSSAIVAGLISIPVFLASLSPAFQPRRRVTWQPVGWLKDFAIGEVHERLIEVNGNAWPRTFRQQAVFVWRRSETDIIVFSRSCTDLGCPLDYDAGSTCFFCPCHGGIFTQNGEHLAGPPNRPMYRYEHRVRAEMLEIDVASLPPAA
jgi:menaquinol-cytochrome c reductase iron-sulfur subunit